MSSDSKERSGFLRVLFAIIWLPILTIFGVALVGVITGWQASSDAYGYQEAYDLSYQASFDFMLEYRIFVFLGIFIVWLLLSIFGKLPGNNKNHMKLKTLLLIFILYTPFANAVNLVCQTGVTTDFQALFCQGDGCEYKSDEMFSVIFDSGSQKIIEATDFKLYNGKDVYDEEVTSSHIHFKLPHMGGNGSIWITIDRNSGDFTALGVSKKDEGTQFVEGKCRIGRKLF